MNTKLTLTIEQEVIRKAKALARKKNKSLSSMIENYLKALVARDNSMSGLSPSVRKLLGSVKLPGNTDYREVIADEIKKKHLK